MTKRKNENDAASVFLCIQFIISGILNIICNGVFFGWSHRQMNAVHYAQTAMDAFITCVCITLLVVFPTVYFTMKAVRKGQQRPWHSRWSVWLPDKTGWWWLLCLIVAVTTTEIFIAFLFLLHSEWLFWAMLMLHCLWCGLLGGLCALVTAWRFLTKSSYGVKPRSESLDETPLERSDESSGDARS